MPTFDIVAAARRWLGVPYQHQGRSRLGVDCVGLVILLLREGGIVPADFDVQGYARIPDGTMLRQCDAQLERAPLAVGAIAVMRFDRDPQHMAVVCDYRHGGLSLVHALEPSRRVVEHRIDSATRHRIVQAYTWRV